jgi:hypothetical protein
MADRTETVVLDFEVDESDSVESIQSITKASKELREERSKLNLQSVEGQKRVKEINAALDSNNSKIKENVSALEKQRINVGNYKSALDGVHPALGKVATGLESGVKGLKAMTMQALAFLATPLGAALAAIVVVFGLLKTALSQNDALMDKFENVTNAVGVVIEVLVSRVGKLGEALIKLATFDVSGAVDSLSEAFGGLADEIENAVRQQQIFLDASRDLEDAERRLRIETEKQGLQIAKLIKESKNRNLTLDEASAKLEEAAKKESDLQRVREDLARRALVITASQLRADKEFQQQSNENFEQYINRLLDSEKLRKEEKDKLADAVIKLDQARNSSLVLQQKIENDLAAIQDKRTEAIKKQNEALEEQERLRQANIRAAREEIRSSKDGVERVDKEDPLIGAFETQLEITEDFNERINEANNEAYLEDVRNKRKAEETKLFLQETAQGQALETTEHFLRAGMAIANRESAAFKAFATAQTLISTFQTGQLAYKSAFLPVATVASPALGAINAAIAVAQGLAQVAAIHGIEFAEGGYTGAGGKYEYAGRVHKGEVVWNQEDVAKVGGPMAANAMRPTYGLRQGVNGYNFDGGLVTNSISTPINQQLEIANIVKNMPAPVVGVKEVTKMQNRVRVKEQASKR